MNENEFQALSAGYALNALSPAERRAVDAALAEHPEWEVHMRTDVNTAAFLAENADPVAPPADLRASLLARIATTPQNPPSDDEPLAVVVPDDASSITDPAPRRARRTWFVLAASLVLVAALGIGAVVVAQQAVRPAAVIALQQIQDSPDAQSATFVADGVEATAYWSSDAGQAVLVSDGLPSLGDDETFELWYVRDGAPISAGTFSASAGDATALLGGAMQPGDIIAVTVEPAGGSPTGSPSTAPIVAIET